MHYFVSILVLQSSLRGRESWLLCYYCHTDTIHILWLFLTVSWVGLQYVVVAFPDHTHLHFYIVNWLTYQNLNENFKLNELYNVFVAKLTFIFGATAHLSFSW